MVWWNMFRLTPPRLAILVIVIQMATNVQSTATLNFVATNYAPAPTRNILVNGVCCSGSNCFSTCSNVTYLICFSGSPMQTCDSLSVLTYITLPKSSYQMTTWTGQVYALIYTYCSTTSQTGLLDKFVLNYTAASLGQGSTVTGQLVGSQPSYPLSYSASVACDQNYYGPSCTTQCIAMDSCSGHYTCDTQTGAKVCRPNWNGTACTTPIISSCPANLTIPASQANSNCSTFDVVFLIYNSVVPSSSTASSNFNTAKQIISSFAQRVTFGPLQYQISVVTATSRGGVVQIPLQSNVTAFLSALDQVTFLTNGISPQITFGLSRVQTVLSYSNGARPYAGQVLVAIDTTASLNSASTTMTQSMINTGVDVFFVTLSSDATSTVLSSLASKYSLSVSNVYAVGQTLTSNDVAASIAVGVAANCIGISSRNVSSLPIALTSPTGPDRCCNYFGTWNPAASKCCCTPGFAGDYCQYRVDPCSGNPCNTGTCASSGTSYTCTCPAGFSGKNCETIATGLLVRPLASPSQNCTTNCTTAVSCGINMYNPPACNVYCEPQDICAGHYACNQADGSKICLAGWGGADCTVSTNASTANCCENGGLWSNGICCCPLSSNNCTIKSAWTTSPSSLPSTASPSISSTGTSSAASPTTASISASSTAPPSISSSSASSAASPTTASISASSTAPPSISSSSTSSAASPTTASASASSTAPPSISSSSASSAASPTTASASASSTAPPSISSSGASPAASPTTALTSASSTASQSVASSTPRQTTTSGTPLTGPSGTSAQTPIFSVTGAPSTNANASQLTSTSSVVPWTAQNLTSGTTPSSSVAPNATVALNTSTIFSDQVVVSGPLYAISFVSNLQKAIVDAFVATNKLASSNGIVANVSTSVVSDSTFCLTYYIVSYSTNSVKPSNASLQSALSVVGFSVISTGGDCPAPLSSTVGTAVVIAVAGAGGIAALAAIVAVVMGVQQSLTAAAPAAAAVAPIVQSQAIRVAAPPNFNPYAPRGNFLQPPKYAFKAATRATPARNAYVTRLQIG